MHAVWQFLLDGDFLHAYRYGMVILCHDGIERRVYPRIITYSADYPEKCVLFLIYLRIIKSLTGAGTDLLGFFSPLFKIRASAHVRVVWYQM